MSTFGNGFLAYHIEVQVKPGCAQAVKTAVNQLRNECRAQAGWPGFPESMLTRLKGLPGVLDVRCEGPQSAVLIPLRMIQSLTRSTCRMSTTVGTGLIAQSIQRDLESWDIDLEPVKRLENADSPLEFSFRNSRGDSASLILYPCSRRRYQAGIQRQEEVPDQLVLNRYNQGLITLANDVASAGGVVSFRPRELGRHDRIEDWASLLTHTHHLTISSRHGAMKAFSTYEGIDTPRGWPETNANLHDPIFAALAEALTARMRPDAIVLLHRLSPGDTLFSTKDKDTIVIPAPKGYGNESRMARLQGALLAMTSQRDHDKADRMDDASWQRLCADTVRLAWLGTECRPWRYPGQQEANAETCS